MRWTVTTFQTNCGKKPIDDFFKKQSVSTQTKITHLLDLLERHGNTMGMPYSKHLDRNLFELRIHGKQEIRILYCFKKNEILLLHVFKKQTQKTPRKELEIAIKRMGA